MKSYQWAKFQEARLLFRFSFHSSHLLIFVGGEETDPKERRPQSDLSIALQSWNYSADETRGCYSDTLSVHQKPQRQLNCWAVWPYRLGSAHHFPAPASRGRANKGGKQCQLQLATKGPWLEHRHGTPKSCHVMAFGPSDSWQAWKDWVVRSPNTMSQQASVFHRNKVECFFPSHSNHIWSAFIMDHIISCVMQLTWAPTSWPPEAIRTKRRQTQTEWYLTCNPEEAKWPDKGGNDNISTWPFSSLP